MFNTAMLEPGKTYAFRTQTQNRDRGVVTLARCFLGTRDDPTLPCIEVARATGKTHLIALSSIVTANLVRYPD